MSYTVTATDLTSIRLNEVDTVNSVLQNIAIILSTRKGSVPLYRDFGLSMEFMDRPLPVAKVMMVAEVREAVERWEPRARVLSVSFAEDTVLIGALNPIVEVEIINEQE